MGTLEEHKYQIDEGSKFWHASFKVFVDTFRNKMDDMSELYYLKCLIEARKKKYIKEGEISLAGICKDELFFIDRRFEELGYNV